MGGCNFWKKVCMEEQWQRSSCVLLESGLMPTTDHCDAKSKMERIRWCGTLWHSSAQPHQLVRQQGGHQGRCAGRLELCPCSWGPITHMGLLIPRAVSLVLTLQSVVQGGRSSLEESLPLLKQCKSWRFWRFCFAGDGRRGLLSCKGSNWSSIATLFIYCYARMRTIWWPQHLKISTETNACSCIYSCLLDTGENSFCLFLKVIVPSLSNNKILIRVTGIILVYPWQSAKACITLQAYCQILVSAKDALDLWSW